MHGDAITRQRVGTRIGLFKFGGGVPEPMAQRCLRGSLVQFARLATLAKSILIGRLQAKAEVLRRLACEPLNLPRSGRVIALDVSDFEEALVDPRSAESLRPQFLRQLLGLGEPIQAHVGVQLAPVRRFNVRLKPSCFLALLEALFELPQVYVLDTQVVTESPKAGIVLDTQPICVNRFVRLALIRVVGSRNEVTLELGNSVNQTESFLCVFPAALYVPGIVERDAEHEVSHREIWIECNGALKQRDSVQELALSHLGITRGIVLESFQRWSRGLFERTIQPLDRVE